MVIRNMADEQTLNIKLRESVKFHDGTEMTADDVVFTFVGKACSGQVVFRVLPEASTRVSALLAGEVDIITNVPQDLTESLSGNESVQVKTAAGTQPS